MFEGEKDVEPIQPGLSAFMGRLRAEEAGDTTMRRDTGSPKTRGPRDSLDTMRPADRAGAGTAGYSMDYGDIGANGIHPAESPMNGPYPFLELLDDWPSLDIVMPIYNEGGRLPRALGSLANQTYPASRLQVLIPDAGSTDSSLDVIHQFEHDLDIRILDNSVEKHAEVGKTLAIESGRGDLILFMDADEFMTHRDALRLLIFPLVKHPHLSGSIAPWHYTKELTLWSRFLSCDEFQRDPLVEVLTPSIEDFVVERRREYEICRFTDDRIPPMGGTTVFRREDLIQWQEHSTEVRGHGLVCDVDVPAFLIRTGNNEFSFVRETGWAHQHCDSLRQLLRKRIRNLQTGNTVGARPDGAGDDRSFLADPATRDFTWVDIRDRRQVWRISRWILGTNLLLPRFVEGLFRSLRTRRWEHLLRPIVAVTVTDALIFSLISTRKGRAFLRSILKPNRHE